MMQRAIEAGLEALDGFGDVVRGALLDEAPTDEVIAQVTDVEAGLADIAAEAARQGRVDAADRFEALRAALSCIAAHLARGDRRAALDALIAGSFGGALAALKAQFVAPDELSPPAEAEEGAAA